MGVSFLSNCHHSLTWPSFLYLGRPIFKLIFGLQTWTGQRLAIWEGPISFGGIFLSFASRFQQAATLWPGKALGPSGLYTFFFPLAMFQTFRGLLLFPWGRLHVPLEKEIFLYLLVFLPAFSWPLFCSQGKSQILW